MTARLNPPIFYQHEHYSCPSCHIPLVRDDISDDWQCKTCQSAVWIYARAATGKKQVLKRVRPAQLRSGDLVVLPGSNLEFVYPVISCESRDTDVRVALRGYRTLNLGVHDPIECIIGGWGVTDVA
jgi:hypothetical protein